MELAVGLGLLGQVLLSVACCLKFAELAEERHKVEELEKRISQLEGKK